MRVQKVETVYVDAIKKLVCETEQRLDGSWRKVK